MEGENETEVKIIPNNFNKKNKKVDKNEQNFGELTKEQFDLMKKIREEAITRTEKYSELIKDPRSSDIIFRITDDNTNNKKKKNIVNKNNDSLTTSNNTLGFINTTKKEEEINPNKERLFNSSHPFLFIQGEPIIIVGPDTQYYVWIFSFVSFFSIIIYSLKNSHILFKLLFFAGYLFFAITYTMLLLLNPGFPRNKNKIDPDMLKVHYHQCPDCNGIHFKREGKVTLHCNKCKICIEDFDHHCTFATKCIGRGNKGIFKIWLYSIGIFFFICFIYLLF